MADQSLPPNSEEFQDPLENYDQKAYVDRLEKALIEETVDAIQHQPVATITPDTSVREAIDELADLHVSCLLIEEEGRLVGVFSHRDVLAKAALEYDEVKTKPVSELMTTDPVFVYETDSSAAALSVMAVSGFRHVPVTDVQRNVIGVISPQRVTTFLRKHILE